MEESVFSAGSEGEAQAGGERGTSAHPTTGCREGAERERGLGSGQSALINFIPDVEI